MDLIYIIRKATDSDGLPFHRHFLVDTVSQRAWGYVETPSPDEMMFVAIPYDGTRRWYLTLEAAKAYLEHLVWEQDLEECEKLTKNVQIKPPVPVTA